MKLEQAHIDQLTTAFKKMQSKEDLLHLLNEAKPLIYGEKAVPFELKQLTWYANPKLGGKRYTEFKIKKKSGAARSIHAPVKGLKSIQKTLSFVLQCVFEPHHAATGFVRDKSILDNARLHEASKYVYNIDLKDFFPSIDQARVWKCFQLKPFNLTDSEMASEEENTTRLQTGVRKFITDHNELIYYKIQDNSLILVIDKKGNFRKYKKRLTGHLDKPNIPLLGIEAGDMGKLREFNRQVNDIIFVDAKRYISSPDNMEALNRLVSSRKNLANMIASLCCTEIEVERKNATGVWEKVKRNVLPQGAPTSPVITNIVCQRLDHLLSGVARRFGLKYSRYADDITFSSMHNVYQTESEFLKELNRIIAEQNFHIKESKTRLQKDGYRKEVTGLLVNEKANVQQRYIKQLRMWLYYWERYGYERASGFFLQEYLADRGHIKKGKPDMANVIAGKLDYLKMVKGSENQLYLKLRKRFVALSSTKSLYRPAIILAEPSNVKIYGRRVMEIKESINLIEENNLSKLENGIYLIVTENVKYLIRINNNNNVIILEDGGKGVEEVSFILNEAYKLNLKLPDTFKVYKIENYENTLTGSFNENKNIDELSISNIVTNKIEVELNNNSETSNSYLPIIHHPLELVNLLKNFSNNDSALKYTTHSWDAGRDANMFKDLSEFLSIAKSQYSEFSFALKGLSENLNGKIYNFLFNKGIAKSGWGDINPKKRIYFGWSSPELLAACKNDISLNPEDFILPEKFQIQRSGKTLQKFKHIIDVFKNEIEVRDENSALLNLILQKHDNYLISFSAPKVSNLENKTFYTDIQWLSKALDLIFEGIQKYPQHPVVEYAVIENNNDRLVLTILHRDSFKNGLSIYDDKLNLKRGDFSTIKDKLRNLCDWCIESEFAEGAYRINYLVSDNEIPAYEKVISADGFKHILTFYK